MMMKMVMMKMVVMMMLVFVSLTVSHSELIPYSSFISDWRRGSSDDVRSVAGNLSALLQSEFSSDPTTAGIQFSLMTVD